MKKLGIVILSMILFAACEQIDDFTKFDVDYETTFSIPDSINVDTPVSLETPSITTNASQRLADNNTSTDLVEEIVLSELTLDVQTPADGNFQFLKNISISINAEGMEEQLLASRESIPEDIGDQLVLETGSADLKEYLLQDSFQLKMNFASKHGLDQDHEIKVRTVFTVNAEVLGQ